MKPFDPRLLRYARASRSVFGVGGLLGVLRAGAIILWCWTLASAIALLVLPVLGGMGGGSGRVGEGVLTAQALPLLLAGATAALLLRSGASWAMDAVAVRGAVRAKAQLRAAALNALDRRSPEWLLSRSDVSTATALGRGLDALDGYFAGYVPQLILTVCATPILVLTVLLVDPVSGLTVLFVFPIIPLFMVLIGLATRAVQDRQWQQLQHLSRSFLDVVEGLTTLKIYRREARQQRRITQETQEYRSRTMQVLRVTFLSGFVLDLAGTFSIALVAVTVGTRLVNGEFPLTLGLFVLLLLPEVFIPIRQVGAAFHASTEGLAAAQSVFEIIEDSALQDGALKDSVGQKAEHEADIQPPSAPHTFVSANAGIHFDSVTLDRAGSQLSTPMSFSVDPGEWVGLAGPSGAGKSSLLAALMGFIEPTAGSIVRPTTIAWSGQRPGLLQGTVAENVALGADTIDAALVRRALHAVGLDAVDPQLQLGVAGAGLSGGQAQRLSIARCLYRAWTLDAGAIVLDEPSSALDADSEALVCGALRQEAAAGRAVLVVSHRPALLAATDRVIEMGAFR